MRLKSRITKNPVQHEENVEFEASSSSGVKLLELLKDHKLQRSWNRIQSYFPFWNLTLRHLFLFFCTQVLLFSFCNESLRPHVYYLKKHFFKRANPRLFLIYFRLFKHITQFLQKINVKNVHPVYGVGIWTHDIW